MCQIAHALTLCDRNREDHWLRKFVALNRAEKKLCRAFSPPGDILMNGGQRWTVDPVDIKIIKANNADFLGYLSSLKRKAGGELRRKNIGR